MILVTGATGTIGTETVRILDGMRLPVRALVRNAARAPRDGSWSCTDVAVGDFDQPDTLDAAMTGVDTLVLISPADGAVNGRHLLG
ncbi:NAD(P)H-binding protein, partial [Streptomyces sp. E5N91]|uniref:SDR family oxidoreductase n=1 Tax=Streptomyces sp. E5N91 TaxID=1851996 RepID=UPI0012921304